MTKPTPATTVKPATDEQPTPDPVGPKPTQAAMPPAKGTRKAFSLVLSPAIYRQARVLAALSGQSVSAMVEADLLRRIKTDLPALIEHLGE